MPNFGSTKQNTGGKKISDGTSQDLDMGQLNGFGTGGGARNKRGLKNDNGAGGGRFKDTDNTRGGDTRNRAGARNKGSLRHDPGSPWKDTDNDQSGDGFGGAPKRLR